MQRRDFLKAIGISPAVSLVGGCSSFQLPETGRIASGVHRIHEDRKIDKFLLVGTEKGLVTYFSETMFPPHSIYEHPHERGHLFLFDKGWPTSARIKSIHGDSPEIEYFKASDGHFFYGHTQFLNDGEVFASTERAYETYKGKITIRESSSLKLIEEYPLQAIGAHDCLLMPDKKTLAVVSDGILPKIGQNKSFERLEESRIVFLDLASGKTIATSPLDRDDLFMGHLTMSQSGDIFASMAEGINFTGKKTGLTSKGRIGEEMKTLAAPPEVVSRVNRESFSLMVDEIHSQVVTLNPAGNIVISWDLSTGKYRNHLSLNTPSGVCKAPGNKEFIITANKNTLYHVDADSLKVIRESSLGFVGAFESHATFLT